MLYHDETAIQTIRNSRGVRPYAPTVLLTSLSGWSGAAPPAGVQGTTLSLQRELLEQYHPRSHHTTTNGLSPRFPP